MGPARLAARVVTLALGAWLAGAPAAAQAPGGAPAQAPAAAPTPARPPAGKKAEERAQPVTVDADRMERFGKENLVVFTGNVVARQDGSVQHTDRMEVYLDERGDRILRTVSTGNVKIATKDCRFGSAQRAEYFEPQKLVRLIGNARVWQDDNVVTGDTIDFYLSEDRAVVEAGQQGRVKAQFFPREEGRPGADGAPPPARAAAPCQN
jgi:lipopolysaccharide export system protein LptA